MSDIGDFSQYMLGGPSTIIDRKFDSRVDWIFLLGNLWVDLNAYTFIHVQRDSNNLVFSLLVCYARFV